MVVLGELAWPFECAGQALLRTGVAVLDAHLVAWWKVVDRLRDDHLVGHALLRPFEVCTWHGGLGAERADEVGDAVENVGVPWVPQDGARLLVAEVHEDVSRRPPAVHTKHRLGSPFFFLTMIGGDEGRTMIDGELRSCAPTRRCGLVEIARRRVDGLVEVARRLFARSCPAASPHSWPESA